MQNLPILVCARLAVSICVVTVAWPVLTANADVLWLVGEENPRYGRVVRQKVDGDLEFRVRGENNTYIEQTFAAGTIEMLVVNVDLTRMKRLDPAHLIPYREYAEELAGQKRDPEARDLAIRLFLIAAAGASRQNDSNLTESALAGLPELARSDQERRAFDRLLMLYSRYPRPEPTPREPEKRKPSDNTDARTRQRLLQAIRLIRQEDNESAIVILRSREVLRELEKWSDLASVIDVQAMTRSSRLSLSQLRKLLALEIALADPEYQLQASNRAPSWGEQAQNAMSGWTRLPSFENVTEFDPHKSVFRNGRWIKPTARKE